MTGDSASEEIPRYVERVRAALADLPPAVRDELTEDLTEHLTEVAAEADGTLVNRIGTPEAYAAELRAAAGAGTPDVARNLDRRIATTLVEVRSRLRAVDRRLGPVIGHATASEYLRLLRPAWWLVRGYLAAMLITVMLTGTTHGLLPRLGGSTLAAMLLLGVCVTTSVWLGRRTPALPRWPRIAVGVSTALLLLFGLTGFVEADRRGMWTSYDRPSQVVSVVSNDKVRDVFVYDSQGRLVENARLFDQDGDPIRLGYPECPTNIDELREAIGMHAADATPRTYPYCPSAAPYRFQPPAAPELEQSPPGLPSAPTPAGTVTPTAPITPMAPTPSVATTTAVPR